MDATENQAHRQSIAREIVGLRKDLDGLYSGNREALANQKHPEHGPLNAKAAKMCEALGAKYSALAILDYDRKKLPPVSPAPTKQVQKMIDERELYELERGRCMQIARKYLDKAQEHKSSKDRSLDL